MHGVYAILLILIHRIFIFHLFFLKFDLVVIILNSYYFLHDS